MKLFIHKAMNFLFKWLMIFLIYPYYGYALESFNGNTKIAKDTAFIGANVLNPSTDIPISNATILVSKGNIIKIQPSEHSIPAHFKVVNIKGQWVIPGLIDGHIHLAQSGSAFTRPDTIDATKITSYKEDQQWLLENTSRLLNNYIKLGITSIFDMGGPSEYLTRYKELTENGVYPDIYAAGTLISPMDMPSLNLNGKTFTRVSSAEEATSLVKKQLNYKTHIIKFVWSQETGLSTHELFTLYKPAIELAHKYNKVVAVHVEDLINAKMAIKAGADVLVHGVTTDFIDDEFISLMETHNVTYMPTLTAYSHYFELFKNELEFSQFESLNSPSFVTNSFKALMNNVDKTGATFQILLQYLPKVDEPETVKAKLSARDQSIIAQLKSIFSVKYEKIQRDNLSRIIDSDVNVALGTDAGNPGTLHAVSMMGEFIAWQEAGISNKQILKAATLGNASALKLGNSIGTLLAGKHANFVVLKQNPYQVLSTLANPVMTVKRGAIVKFNGIQPDEK